LENADNSPPPGWYQNPDGEGHRWWDGERWTEHVRDAGGEPPSPSAQARSSGAESIERIVGTLGAQRRPFWFAVLGLVVMILGSFGPWIRALFVSVSGTEGDGLFFIIGAAIAFGSLWVYAKTGRRTALVWPILLGAGVAADSARIIYEIEQESRAELFGEEIEVAQVQWGLYATLIAGAVVTLLCLYLLLQHQRPRTAREHGPGAAARIPTPVGEAQGDPDELETRTVAIPAREQAAADASQEQRGSRRSTAWLIAGGGAVLALAVGIATAFILSADEEADEAGTVADESPTTETVTTTESRAEGLRVPDTTVTFRPYDIGAGEFSYYTELPSGAGWSEPSQEEPVPGELERTTVRGPGEMFVFIDRTPSEVPKIGGDFDSRRIVYQPKFGVAHEYVISQSESIPECMGSPCIDYLIEDGRGGGWGVLAGGTTDLALARRVGRPVMRSIR
jgi:Protein of unknown function (DUF2510)